jgi:ABC-type transport system involved in cytochrome c biogenesis permease subunit
MRLTVAEQTLIRRVVFGLACCAALAGSPALAADQSAALDWSAWRRLPVFLDGRVMPLDSFARDMAESICGRVRPKLSLDGAGYERPATAVELTAARVLLPEGKPRRFEPYELLFSWLVEPERWDNVPFLAAEHGQLRQELLGLPLLGPDGERLKYAAPRQVERATALESRLRKLQMEQGHGQANYEEHALTGLDKKASDLYQALRLFRLLTFQPAGPIDPRGNSYGLLVEAVERWRGMEESLEPLQAMPGLEGTRPLVGRVQEKMKRLVDLAEAGEKFEPEAVEPLLVELRTATGALAEQYKKLVDRLFREPDKALPPSMARGPEELRQVRAKLQELATGLAEASRQFGAAQHALYDSGRALRLVPALNPAALEGTRDTSDPSQPWLSLQSLLFGSPAVMARYPQAELEQVRKTFAAVKAAYLDRQAADRPARFAAAMNAFAHAVRTLGEKLEPVRRQLPIAHRDEAILRATAYPPPGAVDAELHYNDVDPFFWSWIVNLLALATLALAFGVLRRPLFWLGVSVLVAGQVMTCYGFGLRTYVTGWAPVTGMFESVVFVALVAAMLGLWFTLQPLVATALSSARRLTALPGTWEATPLSAEELKLLPAAGWRCGMWLSFPLRLALMVAVFYALAWYPYGSDGKSAIISLWPRTDVGNSMPSVMDVVTWLVGLSVLVVSVWYAPRAALAVLPVVVLMPIVFVRLGIARPMERALERKSFAMVGAATAFLVAFVAYYSPLWPKEIGTLMPVLRDRFWLYLHVLTITASYGAGLLGLGLGDIALLYYLLGAYRVPEDHSATLAAQGHRPAHPVEQTHGPHRQPPEVCAVLSGFIYKSMQVAVILLAAGTILGGLWADVAWGRFWGWDAKEVWALISLLVYTAILHGRYAGWFGAFGLAAGSVLGASAIIMAWYGVNYWLRTGLHTYAQGSNDQMQHYVFAFILAQWALLAAAGIRYRLETTRPRQ